MPLMYFFWDKLNDELNFFDEDGEFWMYGEDNVAKEEDPENYEGYWMRSHKMQENSPLNIWERYDIYVCGETDGMWIEWSSASPALVEAVHKHAKDPDWHLAHERP